MLVGDIAPIAAAMLWTTAIIDRSSTTSQDRAYPVTAPTTARLATVVGSASEAAETRPGPKPTALRVMRFYVLIHAGKASLRTRRNVRTMASTITAREFKLLLKPDQFQTKRSVLEFN